MDACDFMMESVDLKKGLIGYKTEESIANGVPFKISARIMGYMVVLTVLTGIFISLMLGRSEVETTILRTPGVLYQTREDGRISNLYNYKVINKTNTDFTVTFKLENVEGEIKHVGNLKSVKSQEVLEGVMFIVLDKEALDGVKTNIKIGIYNEERSLETVKTNFMGPAN